MCAKLLDKADISLLERLTGQRISNSNGKGPGRKIAQTVADEELIRTVERAWKEAFSGAFDGEDTQRNREYLTYCTHILYETGILFTLSRDIGLVKAGVMSDEKHDRCLHLSICFTEPKYPGKRIAAQYDRTCAELIVRAIFPPQYIRCIWEERPANFMGRTFGAWDYRVWATEEWEPIVVWGDEVRELIPDAARWISWYDKFNKVESVVS